MIKCKMLRAENGWRILQVKLIHRSERLEQKCERGKIYEQNNGHRRGRSCVRCYS